MNDPRIIDSPAGVPDWDAWDGRVRKIVLGQLEKNEKEEELRLAALPENLAQRFPQLTHLYLWGITGLKALPELPPGLECLDVRDCQDLERLPALPSKLETLDLGGCAGLQRPPAEGPSSLKRLYLNGCTGLKQHHISGFLERLSETSSSLEEIDGSGTALGSLEEVPRLSLRKLRLRGCEKLGSVGRLHDFEVLEHLDLSGCTALQELPSLPPRLRYMLLYDAEKLTLFMGQDIGPYDRGDKDENVAQAFLSRKKFGSELAVMPHAKLLLMGDGRVGKTTLAKRLQWDELSEQDRQARADLKPRKDEDPTHRVRFWQWRTGLRLSDEVAGELNSRAASRHVDLPRTESGDLVGELRIWDFGGQELYHQTHRIFAGEGSIFLVVWRPEKPDPGKQPSGVTNQEWEEWNRHRTLDYWLDYIYSMRPDATVALVCTGCENPDQLVSKPDWKTRAPKHAHRGLKCFWVDSLSQQCGTHREYRQLVQWIREACAEEARRIGVLQPLFYKQVSDLVTANLVANAEKKKHGTRARNLVFDWSRWLDAVREMPRHSIRPDTSTLSDGDIEAITTYLHKAGHLFFIRRGEQRAVIVDQDWAAEQIYQLLLPGGLFREQVRENEGRFFRVTLEEDAHWKAIDDDLQRERLLAYMQECRIVTQIGHARHQLAAQDIFLASDKWLLPEFDDVRERVELRMRWVEEQPGMDTTTRFAFEELTVSEFEFRSLQGCLAQTFQTDATYFRNGLVATPQDQARPWYFQLKWQAVGDDPFEGKLDGVLVAPRSPEGRPAMDIEDLILGDGSPLAQYAHKLRRTSAERIDLRREWDSPRQGAEPSIGLSSSGADSDEAVAIKGALEADGFRVTWYRSEECRQGEEEKLAPFMKTLCEKEVLILLLSGSYLGGDPVRNLYCAYELADAILRLADGRRKVDRTIVIYKPSNGLDSLNMNDHLVRVFASMAEYYGNAYAAKPWNVRSNFRYYDEWSLHFSKATDDGRCLRFFEERGTLGKYLSMPADTKAPDAFAPLIAAVKKATGGTT